MIAKSVRVIASAYAQDSRRMNEMGLLTNDFVEFILLS